MKTIQPYLLFNGNCREAMQFYAAALGGELHLSTYGEMPEGTGMPPSETPDRIMHARLAAGAMVLMASDASASRPVQMGSNMNIAVECSDRAEQERLFTALGEGGTVTMPLQDTFWGSHFGMLEDRFGIEWMLDLPQTAS